MMKVRLVTLNLQGRFKVKMLQLALFIYLLIPSFVFCVEIVYKHAFSLLSKWAPGAVDFFYNNYCHITDTLVRILFLT